MDDDASPEVLEIMEVAANIHEDDTITPDGGKLIVGQNYASNIPSLNAPTSSSFRDSSKPIEEQSSCHVEDTVYEGYAEIRPTISIIVNSSY